jgi:hypothetical protein
MCPEEEIDIELYCVIPEKVGPSQRVWLLDQ